jgi:5'-nucleotidase
MSIRKQIELITKKSFSTNVESSILPSFKVKKQKHITILHTNDTHSQIEPFLLTHPKFPNKGGISRRATLIDNIRIENPNTLLLDAGDIFQGTPYFNYFGGEVELKLMSMLKYDLATIGNHDFDNSINGFDKQLTNANFNFVSANYDFRDTVLDTKIKPYQIFIKDNIKIGVFGLGVELKGLVNPKMYKETKYINPIEITQDVSRILKEEEKCDLIICLSHLGYYYSKNRNKISDLNLAKATKNVDLIIGGHTHTFLPKPSIVKNINNNNVLVNQVGAYGVYLGRVDFYFDSSISKSKSKAILIK